MNELMNDIEIQQPPLVLTPGENENDIEVHSQPQTPEPQPLQPTYFDTPTKTPPRRQQLPKRFQDDLPPVPTPIEPPAPPDPELAPSPSEQAAEPTPVSAFTTKPDEFGLFCIYDCAPTHDPNENVNLETVADAPTLVNTSDTGRSPLAGFGTNAAMVQEVPSETAPFLNISIFRIMNWFHQMKEKSLSSLNDLVWNVILPKGPNGFRQEHFEGFDAHREGKRMDEYEKAKTKAAEEQPLPFNAADGWTKSSVKIRLPRARHSWESESVAPEMTIDNVWHRDVVQVVKAAFQDTTALDFHMKPFKQMWTPEPDEPTQQIHGEAFWTD
ncbi:hypothetical protein VKT23_008633 [Stygiomarasmius scandens]|uniref:Uncharacterized protein n=1 Tax=Marasmiellus scandens TaxID=2682957 RepID=A0ABR1JMA9_9AGAR